MSYLVMIVLGGFIGCLATMQQRESDLEKLREERDELLDKLTAMTQDRDNQKVEHIRWLDQYLWLQRAFNNLHREKTRNSQERCV